MVSAINLVKMTGLGSEHLLLFELRQDKFKDTQKVARYISTLESHRLNELLLSEHIHSVSSLNLIL